MHGINPPITKVNALYHVDCQTKITKMIVYSYHTEPLSPLPVAFKTKYKVIGNHELYE